MIVRLSIIALTFVFLLGCSLQSAPPQPATGSTNPTPAASPTSAIASAAPAEPEAPSAWTIGLLESPNNLLPFSVDGRAAAPIVEAMFPAPVLGMGYAYTTTGILETLPTLANGGVEVTTASGFLDTTGQFTVTETSQPTTTQQLVVTYRWNPKLRWADGTPLTAADSVFSYELFGEVQASQEAQVARSIIERYEQVDEHTTRAVLKPGRIDPNYLATAWPPLPRHRLQDRPARDALDEFAQQPLGYGPFTFLERQPGDQLVLERNEYWPDHAKLPEQLVFRFFGSADELRNAVAGGTVDVATLERIPQELYPYLDQDQQSGAASVTFLPGPVYEHLDLNLADERLHDPRVRQALAYAINRQGMIDAFFGSKVKPLSSWILPDQQVFYAGDEQLMRYPYDPGKASALLDEAGLTDKDGDGIRELAQGQPLTLTLLTTDTPQRVGMAERIAADLKAVGVQIVTELQPIDQFYSGTGPLYRRNFQLALFAWIAGVDPGGLPLWSCNAVPLQENGFTGNNFSGWCFEAAEWPLRRANSTLDERARAQDYLKHQQLWTQEVPVIPLFQRPIAVIAHPRMQGVQPDPLAPVTWNVDQWTSTR
ncbi:MAG TPA: peptide ABC transporter substrate-binding protein [Herpetosiphonaceae bacterium]